MFRLQFELISQINENEKKRSSVCVPSFLHGFKLHGFVSTIGSQYGFDDIRVRFRSPTPHVPTHSPSTGLRYVPSQLTAVVCS